VNRLFSVSPLFQVIIVVFAVRPQQRQSGEVLRRQLAQHLLGPLASSTFAAVTTTASSNPMVSTTIWRLRPWTSLPPSKPCCSPGPPPLTDWLSILPADGVGARPAATRTCSRSVRTIRAQVPSRFQPSK